MLHQQLDLHGSIIQGMAGAGITQTMAGIEAGAKCQQPTLKAGFDFLQCCIATANESSSWQY